MRPLNINLFTLGDCTDVSTWSNLPFYLYQALRRRARVTPVNLIPLDVPAYRAWARVMDLYDRSLRVFRPDYSRDSLRTRSYHTLVNHELRKTAYAHRDADLNLFLTFSFSSRRYSGVPVAHYCDRTYEHHLEEIGKVPDRNDRRFIRVDRENIENADLVLTTNQPCLEFIQTRYRPRRAVNLRAGTNSSVPEIDPHPVIESKRQSKDVLFVGRGVRRRGVDILIPAFRIFNERFRGEFTLHVVGINPRELPADMAQAPGVRFYPYLDRRVPAELAQYNHLMRSARMFVCPMRPGPFPGVVREVMWHCTPVVISDVSWDLVQDGEEGLVAGALDAHQFARCMEMLVVDSAAWERMARRAHETARELTWNRTVDELLTLVRAAEVIGARVPEFVPAQEGVGRPCA